MKTPISPSATKRLDALRALLDEAHHVLGFSFGFELWDGSTIPANLPDATLRIVIADEGAVGKLIRAPRLDTVLRLYVSGRLDLKNGSIFDLAASRPDGKIGRVLKRLSIGKALKVGARFLFVPDKANMSLEEGSGQGLVRDGTAKANQANIAHHYDVSNEFYRLFLNPEMVYSCGYFSEWHDDLARAQIDKLDMICRKLRLKPGDRFLDVGCGWGALICHAATHYGVTATGITLAKEQAALAREKIARLGLEGKVSVEMTDYADLKGEYDKIASIGMFEHVGFDHHARYFEAVRRVLRPGGLYLHHCIARRTKKSEKDLKKIRPEYRALLRYIFPGGELDTLPMSLANLERHGFEIHDVEGWREHYQRTCRLWWENLTRHQSEAEAIVGVEKTRTWLIYLAGCSLAFGRGGAFINQTLVSKRLRGPSELPPSRADLYS